MFTKQSVNGVAFLNIFLEIKVSWKIFLISLQVLHPPSLAGV